MSNCRDSYCNYGSYLRSRGYDKQICNLVNEIENGNINNGAVNPNSNGNGAVVNGSLVVKSAGQVNPSASNSRMQEGLIYSVGGQLGSSGEFISNDDLGLQMFKGTRINGPIIQVANNSYVQANAQGSSVFTHVNTNIFKGDTHIFTNDGADTNVIIKGSLSFDGSLVQLPDTIETSLTLEAPATHDKEMLTIFHGATEAPGLDIVDVWIDGSFNIPPRTWQERLAFAIDGDLSSNQTIGNNGGTAVHGHTRILRGATVLNRCDDGAFNEIDINYSVNDASLSDVALDVYGKIKVHEGPTHDGSNKADANIELYSNSLANPAIVLQGETGTISGSTDGLKLTDVSNIRFLDGSEIFAGNSLDISSDKVEFLHGDVHVVENLSVSGSLVSVGAAIDTLVVGGTPGLKFVSESDSLFKQTVGISGDLIVDKQVTISGNVVIGKLANPSDLTVFGTLNGGSNVDINGGSINGTTIGLDVSADGSFNTITANNASISTITNAALTSPTIDGGTIDTATIGATTPNPGTFTTLVATTSISGNLIGSVTGNLIGDVTGNVDINGGNIDDTAIGANSASTGVFTTLVATTSISGNLIGNVTGTLLTAAQPTITSVGTLTSVDIDGGAIDGTAIGANSASAGTFTTLVATTSISGNLIGNVTGNLTGDVTGNVSGTVTNGVYTSPLTGTSQTISGDLVVTGTIDANTINANIEYTGHNIEVNTATFSNSLTIGDGSGEFFDVDSGTKTVKIGNKPNSNYSDLVFPGTVTGHDVTVTNTNGLGVLDVSGGNGLRVPKFGLGVTPAGPVTSSSGNNVPDASGGSLLGLKENDKWNGGSGTAYNLNDIVRALKNVGILQ